MNRILIGLVRLGGFACLLLSATKLWFALPAAAADGGTGATITAAEPWSTAWYQAAAVLVAVASCACWILSRSQGRVLVSLLAVWLIGLLLFPWTVMIADPQTAGRATWLQMQHENLTWLGGDLATSQSSAALGWKTRLYVVDTPRRVSMVNPPGWRPWEFGLHRLPDLFEWLGHTNTFCQFVRRGWFLAIGGTCFLLAATCLGRGTLDTRLARQALLVLCGGCFVACLAVWTPPFIAGRSLDDGATTDVVRTIRSRLAGAANGSPAAAGARRGYLLSGSGRIARAPFRPRHAGRETVSRQFVGARGAVCRSRAPLRTAAHQPSGHAQHPPRGGPSAVSVPRFMR